MSANFCQVDSRVSAHTSSPAQSLGDMPWRSSPPDADGWWWVRGPYYDAQAIQYAADLDVALLSVRGAKTSLRAMWGFEWEACPVVLP